MFSFSFAARRKSHKPVQSSFFFLLLLLSFPFCLDAQKALPDTALLRTVVIQSTRVSSNSPAPHTNLNAAAIAKMYQAQDVPYLLTGVPSLVESSDAGTGIGYTGMRIRGSDPTRVNVTINGVPLNDAESQGVYWVDLPDLAASAAEIQVQRGVGSSTNGAGSFGATVNLDLSKIDPQPFALLSNSIGSFNARKNSIYTGTGLLNGKFAFTGRLSSIHSDGYIDRAEVDLKAAHFSGAYIDDRQSLQAHFLSGNEITYQAWNGVPAQYIDDPMLRTYNTAGIERPGAPYSDQVDHYTQQHFLLHYKLQPNRIWALQLNGHYTRGFGYYEQYKSNQDFADYGLTAWSSTDSTVQATDLVRRLWLDNRFYGGTFALRWTPGRQLAAFSAAPLLMLGGGLNQYRGKHYGELSWVAASTVSKDERYYDNDADKTDGNLFYKMELNFNHGWSAFLDLQYRALQYRFLGFDQNLSNVNQSVTLAFFNPKAGLSWQFMPAWTAQLFAGIGNREPNRDDYTQSTPESRPRPERMYDLEAGLKTGGDTWKLSANFFWMYYRDQLVLDGRINDVGAYIRTNVPESYRAGLELEGNVELGTLFTFSGNAAFSKNTVKSFSAFVDNWDTQGQETYTFKNTPIAFSPALIAGAEMTFNVLKNVRKQDLSVSLSGKHVGKQYLDNTGNEQTILKAYFFSNLRLNYNLKSVVGEDLIFIFALNNLFDAHYSANGWTYRYISNGYDARGDDAYTRLEGNGVYNQTGYFPQAGRNWMLSLNLRF